MPDAGDTRRSVVLVVDDEPGVLEGVRRLLHKEGFRVLAARCGLDAESVLGHEQVDVLVLDYVMHDMRGDALYARAVAMQPHLAGRALFLTGDITPQTEELIAATGCPQLGKPFEIAELRARVRSLMPLAGAARADNRRRL